MKKLKSTILKKVMPVFLLVILLFNFIMPNYSYGFIGGVLVRGLESLGGVLLGLIADLTRGLCDVVITMLQNMFITKNSDIIYMTGAHIRYGPAIIFSGNVPGLDINFIEPMPKQKRIQYFDPDTNGYNTYTNGDIVGIPGFSADLLGMYLMFSNFFAPASIVIGFENDTFLAGHTWAYDFTGQMDETQEDVGRMEDAEETLGAIKGVLKTISEQKCESAVQDENEEVIEKAIGEIRHGNHFKHDDIIEKIMENDKTEIMTIILKKNENDETLVVRLRAKQLASWGDARMFFDIANGQYNITSEDSGEEIESVAQILQPTVSKWYKGTRLIAMVGLLSVLLYVGIRIILSSVAADKAKYKKMLLDWLTALCILFILHYLMVFILNTSKEITNIFSNYMERPNAEYGEKLQIGGVDTLMSQIRDYAETGTGYEQAANTVMYASLVILTVIFTFQYLKRVLYMAFLTMIAPLIALTYPIDKVKDGQAQAFNMWIREYIFNALIQPVHFIIYVMLVGSAIDLIEVSPLYAIVAIGFIAPAEKFIRKMFGFEKATTVGQLGAAAGGAMIMNMINKAKGMGGKSGSGSGSGGSGGSGGKSKPVRTPTSTGGGSGSDPDSSSGGSSGSGSDSGSGIGGSSDSASGDYGSDSSASVPDSSSGVGGSGSGIRTIDRFGRRIGGVANSIGKRYKLWGKGAGKQWAKRAAGLVGAGTLGTIGVAAGVATGDLGNALKYGGAGAVAGNALGGGLVEETGGLLGAMKEGWQGEELYGNRQADKAVFESAEYTRLKQKTSMRDHGKLRNYTQTFLDEGVTDLSKVEKGIDNNLSAQDAVNYYKMHERCPSSIRRDFDKFSAWVSQDENVKDLNLSTKEAKTLFNNMNIFE